MEVNLFMLALKVPSAYPGLPDQQVFQCQFGCLLAGEHNARWHTKNGHPLLKEE